jgi:hypothetical protein
MEPVDREILWRQYAAAIDTFGDAVRDCPDELWESRLWDDLPGQWVATGFSTFWYVAYHTLFWLDLYLTGEEEESFAPPAPFDIVEMVAHELLPRVYSQAELLAYLAYCRQKCQETIGALTTEQAYRLCRYPWGEVPYVELLLYNMRHVQEHAAHLGMYLGQQAGKAAE